MVALVFTTAYPRSCYIQLHFTIHLSVQLVAVQLWLSTRDVERGGVL